MLTGQQHDFMFQDSLVIPGGIDSARRDGLNFPIRNGVVPAKAIVILQVAEAGINGMPERVPRCERVVLRTVGNQKDVAFRNQPGKKKFWQEQTYC